MVIPCMVFNLAFNVHNNHIKPQNYPKRLAYSHHETSAKGSLSLSSQSGKIASSLLIALLPEGKGKKIIKKVIIKASDQTSHQIPYCLKLVMR